MKAKFVDTEQEYIVDLRLAGRYRRNRVALRHNEPPLRLLDLEARIFLAHGEDGQGSEDEKVALLWPDSGEREHELACAKVIRAEVEAEYEESVSYVGLVNAFTFPVVPGVIDDCDADSQGAYDAAAQLCDDDGEFHRHVIAMLGGEEAANARRTVVCAWRAQLLPSHIQSLQLALRELHQKFGHGVLGFCGASEHGAYLEAFNFRRVRQPLTQIRSYAARSVKLDVKRGAIAPDEVKAATARLIDAMVNWQDQAAMWIAIA